MYYSVPFQVTKKILSSDISIVQQQLAFDHTHPLVKYYQLRPGKYFLEQLIEPNYREPHNKLIKQSIINIEQEEHNGEVITGRSLMSNPIFFYRTLQLYYDPALFNCAPQKFPVEIRINYLEMKIISLEEQQFKFSIELIPIEVCKSYLSHLDKCLTGAIIEAEKITSVTLKNTESYEHIDSASELTIFRKSEQLQSPSKITEEPVSGVMPITPSNRKYSLDIVENMQHDLYLKAFSHEIIRIITFAKIIYGFAIENNISETPVRLTDLISGLLLFLTMQHKLIVDLNIKECPEILVQESQLATTIFLDGIYNLLHNACKYAKNKIIITLGLDLERNSDARNIWVKVYDDGASCDVNVFDCNRSNSSPLNKGWHGNWSVGLDLTRKLLGRYSGHITLIQTDDAVGKTFSITIPEMMLLGPHKSEQPIDQILHCSDYQEKSLSGGDVQNSFFQYLMHTAKNVMASVPGEIAILLQSNIMAIQKELTQIHQHDIFDRRHELHQPDLQSVNKTMKILELIRTKKQVSILVIDDDQFVLSSSTNMFKKQRTAIGKMLNISAKEITITPYQDPCAAVEFYTSNKDKIDIVITDQNMPGMTGDIIARHMGATCIVVLSSGGILPENMNKNAFDHILPKPITFTGIRELFEHIMLISNNRSEVTQHESYKNLSEHPPIGNNGLFNKSTHVRNNSVPASIQLSDIQHNSMYEEPLIVMETSKSWSCCCEIF